MLDHLQERSQAMREMERDRHVSEASPAAVPEWPRSNAIAISVDEASEMVGVSKSTIRREIDRGRLKAVRVGRRVRVRVSELKAYVERNEQR